MAIIYPKDSVNKKRFRQYTDDTRDAQGGAGLASMKNSGSAKNNQRIVPPTKGDNSSWSEVGKRKSFKP